MVSAGALTIAGQSRIFTAFPSILAIAILNGAALKQRDRPTGPRTVIAGFNSYSRDHA
jgi:hypothetical protein